MTEHDLVLFFFQISTIIGTAMIFGQFMNKIGMPAVIGELIGGIFLGPTFFGWISPNAYQWLFPSTGSTVIARDAIIKIGMIFFLFAAGMEIHLSHLKKHAHKIACTSLSGILIPFSLGFGLVYLIPKFWEPHHAKGTFLLFAIFMGTAMSISALPIVARMFMDLGLYKRELAVIVLASSTMDDLVGWSLFAIILNAFKTGDIDMNSIWITFGIVITIFTLVLTVGRWMCQRSLDWIQSKLTWPSGFIQLMSVLMLIGAALVQNIGIHAIWGAFLVGLALSKGKEVRDQASEIVYQFAYSFFSPFYFVSIGMRANFILSFDFYIFLFIMIIAFVGKIGGAGLASWLVGFKPREAFTIGFSMNVRGALEMILAYVSLDYGLIDERIYVALIYMALITTVINGPIIKRLMKVKPVNKKIE
jgi:Kef-type K+ transport system membrane component KefB